MKPENDVYAETTQQNLKCDTNSESHAHSPGLADSCKMVTLVQPKLALGKWCREIGKWRLGLSRWCQAQTNHIIRCTKQYSINFHHWNYSKVFHVWWDALGRHWQDETKVEKWSTPRLRCRIMTSSPPWKIWRLRRQICSSVLMEIQNCGYTFVLGRRISCHEVG